MFAALLARPGKPTAAALGVYGPNVPIGTSAATIPADNATAATITVAVADQDGGAVLGATVVLARTGTGTLGSVTDNGDGTYSATFVTSQAGAHVISVVANGVPGANTVTVTASAVNVADPAQSTIAVDNATPTLGTDSVTATLTVRDAAGDPLGVGGQAVVFSNIGGTSEGTWSATADNGDGTHTAIFAATVAGTATTVHATLDTVDVTGGTLPTITVAAGAFATPDLINHDGAENGYGNWCDGGFHTVTNPTIDTAQHYAGTRAFKKTLPVTPPQSGGSGMNFPLYTASPLNDWAPTIPSPATTYDRLFAAWRFYLDNDIGPAAILKFNLFQASGFGIKLGGVGFQDGQLNWHWAQEWSGQQFGWQSLAGVAGGWHSIEVDIWRNGDTGGNVITTGDGEPSVGLWLDSVAINNAGTPPAPGYWKNGRVYAGQRSSSLELGVFALQGLLNDAPANTVPGNVWVDDVCLSTSRIGL